MRGARRGESCETARHFHQERQGRTIQITEEKTGAARHIVTRRYARPGGNSYSGRFCVAGEFDRRSGETRVAKNKAVKSRIAIGAFMTHPRQNNSALIDAWK